MVLVFARKEYRQAPSDILFNFLEHERDACKAVEAGRSKNTDNRVFINLWCRQCGPKLIGSERHEFRVELHLKVVWRLEVRLAIVVSTHPRGKRVREIERMPAMSRVDRCNLEELTPCAQLSLVILVVHNEHGFLAAGKVALPWRGNVPLVAIS